MPTETVQRPMVRGNRGQFTFQGKAAKKVQDDPGYRRHMRKTAATREAQVLAECQYFQLSGADTARLIKLAVAARPETAAAWEQALEQAADTQATEKAAWGPLLAWGARALPYAARVGRPVMAGAGRLLGMGARAAPAAGQMVQTAGKAVPGLARRAGQVLTGPTVRGAVGSAGAFTAADLAIQKAMGASGEAGGALVPAAPAAPPGGLGQHWQDLAGHVGNWWGGLSPQQQAMIGAGGLGTLLAGGYGLMGNREGGGNWGLPMAMLGGLGTAYLGGRSGLFGQGVQQATQGLEGHVRNLFSPGAPAGQRQAPQHPEAWRSWMQGTGQSNGVMREAHLPLPANQGAPATQAAPADLIQQARRAWRMPFGLGRGRVISQLQQAAPTLDEREITQLMEALQS